MNLKRKATAMLLALFMTLTPLFPAFAADSGQTEIIVKPTFGQTDARSMLDMINAFRTGDEAFYWNESNTGYVTSKGEPLAYSYALEEIAMQRAAEVALSFSHTRPDNTRCFTATTAEGVQSWGENIAAGSSSASGAFKQWREDNEQYAGQGHRRNMLNPNYSAVGVGHVTLNGTHYWVQEFGYETDSVPQTTALDTQRATTVTVSAARVANVASATVTPENVTLQAGERVDIPTAGASVQLSEAWPGRQTAVDVTPVWTSDNASVCTVDGLEIVGVAAGSATLSAMVLGQSVTVPVTVSGGGTPTPPEPIPADGVYAILYDDGTFVFQNGNTPESGKTVTNMYDVDLNAVYHYDLMPPWYNERESVRVVSFADKITPTSTAFWFYDFENLERVDNIGNLDTSSVTTMKNMFDSCYRLTALDVSGFDTSNVTNMYGVFYNCLTLAAVDVSGFDTSKVTNMYCMFFGCKELKQLNMTSFDTANVTNMRYMFLGCSKLKDIFVSDKFVTVSVTDSTEMFNYCNALVGGNGTKFDSSHIDKEYARIDTPSAPGYFTDKDAPAYAIIAATPDKSAGILSVTLTNSAAVTVAVAYFDTNGQFLSANLRDVKASAGSVEVGGLSSKAILARAVLYDNDCRPLCDPFEVKLS